MVHILFLLSALVFCIQTYNYIPALGDPGMKPLTVEEIKEMQKKENDIRQAAVLKRRHEASKKREVVGKRRKRE